MTASVNVKAGIVPIERAGDKRGQEAAVLVVQAGQWCIRGTVTIKKDTPTSVLASDNNYYARPGFFCRGFSATAKPTLKRKLSFAPDYIATAKRQQQKLEEHRARRARAEESRKAWLQEWKPNMAYRITNKIQTADQEDILKALVNLPLKSLMAICTCLGMDPKDKTIAV